MSTIPLPPAVPQQRQRGNTNSLNRISQDLGITNLTVSNNCVAPCIDEQVAAVLASQTNQLGLREFLTVEKTITPAELYATAPRLAGGPATAVGGSGTGAIAITSVTQQPGGGAGTFNNLTTTSTPLAGGPPGFGCTISVTIAAGVVTTAFVDVPGVGYSIGDTLVVAAAQIVGALNDIIITLQAVDMNEYSFDYPASVTPPTVNSQPPVGQGVIELIPAPGAGKMIVPHMVEISVDALNTPDASYQQALYPYVPPTFPSTAWTRGSNEGVAALSFQLYDRYPTRALNNGALPNGQQINLLAFKNNVPWDANNPDPRVLFQSPINVLEVTGSLVFDPTNSDFSGVDLFSGPPAAAIQAGANFSGQFFKTKTTIYDFLTPFSSVLANGSFPFTVPGGGGAVIAGWDFDPVGAPLTMYANQPMQELNPNTGVVLGRPFKVKVTYTIVDGLE